jgi:hypothetical protein
MMGLLKKERTLTSLWNQPEVPVYGIYLMAVAESTEKGFIALNYEFTGWSEYLELKKKNAGTVF